MELITLVGDLIQTLFDMIGVDMFQYRFMQRALMGLLIVSIMTAVIGVFVVLRGHSFLSLSVSSSAFAGLAIGAFMGWNELIIGFIFALITSIFIEEASFRGNIKPDVAAGIVFSFMFGVALLYLGLMPDPVASGLLLHGNPLGALKNDIYQIFIIALVVLVGILIFNKQFQMITFDPAFAEATGMHVTFFRMFLLLLIALCLTSSIEVVGGLLIISFVVLPAAAAFQLSSRMTTMMIFSIVLSSSSAIVGLLLAYEHNVGPSAAIVVIQGMMFFFCFIISPKRHTFWKQLWITISFDK
ncbi:MAG: metal ABC transporter permease [Candidatus Hodarchaeales archaeon]|jgi:ABC-type Mn2+/Zn2+ transport system permease subunit